MRYNLWFNVCALIVLLALLVINYLKFSAPFKKYTIFLMLLWCSMISTVASITNNILPGLVPVWVVRLSHTMYFLAHGFLPPLLFLYAYSLTDYSLKDWHKLIPWLMPSFFGMLMIPSNWFSPAIFRLDEMGNYFRGPMMPVIYMITAVNFLATAFVLLHNRRFISSGECISLLVFLSIATCSMLVQFAFPRMLVENFACAICLMISQMTVQNPELILDCSTQMLTKQGFANFLSPQFERGSSFNVGFLSIHNYHELEKVYGFESLENKLTIVADYLKQHTDIIFARTDNNTVCFVDRDFLERESWDELMKALDNGDLSERLRQAGVAMRLKIKFGTLQCPVNADSFGSLMELVDLAAKLPQNNDEPVMQLNTVDILALRRRRQIDALVRKAVQDNMLYVVYQPIYCVPTKCFCSAEALLRMRSDLLGNVSPAEFIQIAEENGSILDMTRFVLDTVCDFIKSDEFKAAGLKKIHINLSAVDCMQPDLAVEILNCISQHGVDEISLGLEMTETAFSETSDKILDNLFNLSKTGISIMLDDYGTGYSNLSRLSKVPFDIVKLDKSLVDDILVSDAARFIFDNTVRMIRGLNKRVLIEGVETREQAEYLEHLGCDFIQGYYFARPLDKDTFLHFISDHPIDEH